MRGFVLHCYADHGKNRLFLIGRLEDGRSFAAVVADFRPSAHILERDRDSAERALSSIMHRICAPELEPFAGNESLVMLKFNSFRDYIAAGKQFENAGIISPDGDLKIHDSYCIKTGLKGPVELVGSARKGHLVDLVFPSPKIIPAESCNVQFKIASIDIETDVDTGTILAAGMSVRPGTAGLVRVLGPEATGGRSAGNDTGDGTGGPAGGASPLFHPTEASLLSAFLEDIRKADPDVLTGWNFLDFDFPRLAERCAANKIPFNLGRSEEESKYFPPSTSTDSNNETARSRRRLSAAALVQGRQVLDALRIYRGGPRVGGHTDGSSFSLQAVADTVLGEGKLISSTGGDKIAELKELYEKDKVRFGEYCLRDAELVQDILEKTGLFRLTVERASLTGVSLDKAWTNVVSFERIYGMELHRRGIAPKTVDTNRDVSGAAGGTVLEPSPGLFSNVAVFDFRSLYPTIMLTFNIDPLANGRAVEEAGSRARGETRTEAGTTSEPAGVITAPNGALFSREKGILPGLIAEYFAARQRALDSGDEEASFVYKILMNSFYGVMGTSACRYGLSALAGAITSFARKWLYFSRDWFNQNGFNVLYGDTDSLFVETGLGDDAGYMDFLALGKKCTEQLNSSIKDKIKEEYGLESYLEMRFEKPYRRFLIPPLRAGFGSGGESRGRAKGYGGYLLGSSGELLVEVKGMEAVRSDYTALARRVQVELLELVFKGGSEEDFKAGVYEILGDLRQGKYDAELIYRKRLSRAPETYTASTPPQVKAARALGWKNRRGIVEFVWTITGPEPASIYKTPLDYDHYAESQLLPMARSIASAAGWNADFHTPGQDFFRDGQLELDLGD
ncbi:MAG: DNA polymerase II [Treponema sp.]|nr:DNA polymerase II [Treponema sp.]